MKCPNCGAETQGKVCEYCGSEMEQKATVGVCPKCGGHNVTFKRERVGTATQSHSRKNVIGNGRTGQSVSRFAYRTVGICQSCGHTWIPNDKSKPARKTWLWVLGWICIFPVPLTILMLRKKGMKPAVKYSIIVAAWLLFFVIGLSNNSGTDTPQTDNPSYTETESTGQTTDNMPDSTAENIASENNNTTETAVEATENVVVYAEDEVVNRFISEYNEKSPYEITEISNGNIRTKYLGYSDGRYIEMINANNAGAEAFCITINGGQEDTDKQSMYEVFREIVKILDPSVTDGVVDATLAEFDSKNVLIEGYMIGDDLVVTYVPAKELSDGKNSCRIDISASNYK